MNVASINLLKFDKKMNNPQYQTNPSFGNKEENPPLISDTKASVPAKAVLAQLGSGKVKQEFLSAAQEADIEKKLRNTGIYTREHIAHIIMHTKPETAKAIDMLLQAKNNDGSYRFRGKGNTVYSDLGYIMRGLYTSEIKNPMDYLELLIDAKNNNNEYRFEAKEIAEIISSLSEDNVDLFNRIFNMKNSDNTTYRFDNKADSYSDIGEILNATNLYDKDGVEMLVNAKNGDEYRFDAFNICLISGAGCAKDKLNVLKKLLEDVNFDQYHIHRIMTNIKTQQHIDKFNKLFAIYKSGKPIGEAGCIIPAKIAHELEDRRLTYYYTDQQIDEVYQSIIES